MDKSEINDFIDSLQAVSLTDLIKLVPDIYNIDDPVQRAIAKSGFLNRAQELGNIKAIQAICTAVEKQQRAEERKLQRLESSYNVPVYLDTDKTGAPAETIANFLAVMRLDPRYSGIRYNLISNRAEVTTTDEDGTQALHDWDDADDSASRNYIEEQYKLYSPQKHTDALRILFREREYNPIKDLVETFHWDGVSRCRSFLTKWLHADDSAYTQEVSRLIFAGGINRLYNPGCKFDDVPVLIGTKQGEGKSTIIKWLALNEVWFAEIKRVEGQDSVEAMFGAWICEIPELSAFKKADDVESIKAFVTRTKDKYRKPYDRNPVDYPRRCIFIGTTNNEQFLADKTGNRRFYPVKTSSVGYDLFDHEEEIKEYIRQCWAEARELYKVGKMPPFADRSLLDEYRRRQEAAMEDDWRVGKIADYLNSLGGGDTVCVLELYTQCLYPDTGLKPKLSESRAIGQIISKLDGWESIGNTRTAKYGVQKCWRKKADPAVTPAASVTSSDQLPF